MHSGVVGLLPSDPPSITAADAQRARELGFTGSSVQLGQPDTYSLDEFRRVGDLLNAEGLVPSRRPTASTPRWFRWTPPFARPASTA